MGFSLTGNPFKRDGDSNSGNFLDRASDLARSGGLSAITDLAYDAKRGWSNGNGPGGTLGDKYAALMRDQWMTYVQNFVPIENKLIEYATSPTTVSDSMAEASADVTGAFDSQQAATGRRLKGMGLTLDADEQRSMNRQFGLAKSLADVGAQNTARDATIQRQQSILGNPSPDAIQI